MNDRRKFTDEDKAEIGEIIRHELMDRWSFVKNGHSWGQWFAKIITPERAFVGSLVIVSWAYSFGGGVRDVLAQLKTAAAKAEIASTKADTASTKAETAASKAEAAALTNNKMEEQIIVLQRQIEESKRIQDSFRSDVRSKLSTSITRSEFQSALHQQILPRLERIEKAQPK